MGQHEIRKNKAVFYMYVVRKKWGKNGRGEGEGEDAGGRIGAVGEEAA